MKMRAFFILTIAVLLMGCAPPIKHLGSSQTQIKLASISPSGDITENGMTVSETHTARGLLKIRYVERKGFGLARVETERFSLLFEPTQVNLFHSGGPIFGMAFRVNNKTSRSMKLKWDEVSIVDWNGISHKSIKKGRRFLDRGNPSGDTLIPQGASGIEMLYPVDFVSFSRSWYGRPFLMGGRHFRIVLPFEFQNERVDYTLRFTKE